VAPSATITQLATALGVQESPRLPAAYLWTGPQCESATDVRLPGFNIREHCLP